MSQEQQVLMMLRGLEASLPEEQYAECRSCQDQLREVIGRFGDLGKFAVGLIAAELAAEAV